jgi:hypothetical protein
MKNMLIASTKLSGVVGKTPTTSHGFKSWPGQTLYRQAAAVGKPSTLNCLGEGTKPCMNGATIGSCLLCVYL